MMDICHHKHIKTLNPAQKEQALLQSAILEDDSKSADKLKKMTIPENVTSHVVGENYRIHNKKEKEKIIQIKIPKQYIKANSYIYLTRSQYRSIGWKKQ